MTYVLWPAMAEMAEKKDDLTAMVSESAGRKDFEIIPVITENWNDDLSPWKYEDKRSSFAGNADQFLKKVLEKAEELNASGSDKLVIAGYSLAGLFSLWAASQTEIFDAAVSCSGSLWFPGFTEAEVEPKCSRVYLSLGDREAFTKHPLMRQVEDITRGYAEKLKGLGVYKALAFEMNPGNHFVDALERLSKGIVFSLK